MKRLGIVLVLLAAAVTAHAQAPVVSDLGLLPGDATVVPAANTQIEHSLARGGDQILVTWSDYRGQSTGSSAMQSTRDVFGIRLDMAGNPIDAAPFLIAGGMGTQERPLVAWNGSAWLVVFISQDPVGGYYDNVMRAVRVSAAGQVLDATPISFPPTQYTPNTVGLAVTGLNGQWLITRCIYHADAYGTYLAGQRIDGAGTLLDPTPVMLLDWVYGTTVSLTANGEYLVGGPDWNGIAVAKAQRVSANLTPIGASFSLPSLMLASNGTEYFAVWVKNYVDLAGSRITSTGTVLSPAGITLVPNVTQGGALALTHDGTQWWLAWGINDQIHTLRINAAGSPVDAGGGPALPIAIGGNVNTAYRVTLTPRTGGGVLTSWYDYRIALGNDANVFALPVSAGNAAGSERCVSTSVRNQRGPDFAAGPGGQSALVYVSEGANDRRVMLQRLDPDGVPLTATPITVASTTTTGRAAVAWNGSLYMVTWDGGNTGDPLQQIEARRVNADGSFVDAAPFDVMTGFSPDVEALGGDFLVTCAKVTSPQTIGAFARLVHGATATFGGPVVLLGGSYVREGPRVHSDGTRWLATYESYWTHDASQSDALCNFVSAAGVVTPSFAVANFSGGSGMPDVAFSGGKYLFVWRNNSLSNANNLIAGRVMNPDGTFPSLAFVIAEATGRQLRPVAGWDGTNFLVAWEDQRNQGAFFDERTDIYGSRVSEAGAVIDPTGFVVHAGPQGDADPALLVRPDGHALIADARFTLAPPLDSYRIGLTYVGGGVLDAPVARPALSLASAPNPARDRVSITFALPRDEHVRLAIHDVQGRSVRELLAGEARTAGEHTVAWDARDANGARVAPGVYLVSLRTATIARTTLVVVTE